MIRAVIFDLDGTLVNHLGAQLQAFERGIARLGDGPATHGDADVLLWRQLERRHMDEFLAGDCTFAEQRRRRLTAFLASRGREPLTDERDADWWAAYSGDYEAAWTAYPDAERCLRALRSRDPRLQLGVLTNGDSRQQRAKLQRFGWLDQFEGVFVSDAIGVAKPDPNSFRIACNGLGVAPAETLFVGDLLELDALGACAAGLVGVWLDRDAQRTAIDVTRVETLDAIVPLIA